MVDIGVKSGAAWLCQTEGRQLADVLLPVHISNTDDEEEEEEELSQAAGDETNCSGPVLLQQTAEGSPCVLTLRCSSSSISRLLLITEARTMEVYDETGEYCGTIRGERDDSIQPDGSDRGPFYKKQLILERPSSACEVKLLSLAGRNSVLVCRVVVALKALRPCAALGPGINMQQVQCLVEEMGTSLSPGAQNLMEMVQYQQKNQTGSLGGFLPLLMGGGVFSALTQRTNVPTPAAVSSQPGDSTAPGGGDSIRPAGEAPPAQNGADGSTHLPAAAGNTTNRTSSEGGGPVSHAQLAQMMAHFLKGPQGPHEGPQQVLGPGPELLPMLQSLCGQVTKLRLDDAAALAEKEKMMKNGSWELDAAMERRLEEMERRLKEHVDRRLDALEQKLEEALLNALRQGAGSSSAGDAAPRGAEEQKAPTPATP
ncbi:ATPase PAAT [Centropristis striata]|uniref:ATPase PAAT n=1 Tax=Centropristis striata TaxID=184440 RepID=UPI0027E009A2|nr:ATPase PAAT [Centropristis striata]